MSQEGWSNEGWGKIKISLVNGKIKM